MAYAVALMGCQGKASPETQNANAYPRKPIKVIVPFSAGGGSDTFTRIVQRAIEEQHLLPQPLAVINVPGASGTVGSRRVKNSRPDGYTILQLHDGILTSKYSGNVEYGPEAFTPIAGTGASAHVITVKDDSHFAQLADLVDAAASKPDSIVFAVGIGAPSHFAGRVVEATRPGAAFRFTQSGGGAKRFASLLGGHSDVTTFSVAEFLEYRSGGLRGLAILTDTRHPKLPDVPTAKEQGVDAVSTNMHFWWAPKGTPQQRVDELAETLRSALQTAQVKQRLDELATDPVFLTGKTLTNELLTREQQIASVAKREVPTLPNFPLWALVATLACSVFVVKELRATPRNALPPSEAHRTSASTAAWIVVALLIAYVSVMHFHLLTYPWATTLFVLATGASLARGSRPQLLSVGVAAMIVSFGLYAVFTQLFVIDLP